eukprot:6275353-Pyramimonas_sp.AAC.1
MMIVYVWYNSTSSYGSACANDGKDALNTPETLWLGNFRLGVGSRRPRGSNRRPNSLFLVQDSPPGSGLTASNLTESALTGSA